MGNAWKRSRDKNIRILLVGLNAAGKTSTVYRLKLGEVAETFPTTGYSIGTIDIKYNNVNFTAWDIAWETGGRGDHHFMYRFYYQQTDAVLFVIDSNDRERISECRDELWRLLAEEGLKSSLFLVMANKQDLPNAMSVQEVTEKMELNQITNRKWHIQGTSATTGEGLHEGLNWLQSTLTQKEVKKAVVKPVKEVVNSVLPTTSPSKPSSKPNTSSWWSMLTNYFKTSPVS